MDIKEMLIDQPLLALLVAVPVFVLAALIKVGVVLLSGGKAPSDPVGGRGPDDAAPPPSG